jgi:hypothetical protein
MTTTEELSAALAALEARLREDEEQTKALQAAAEGCGPGMLLPGPPEELLEPLPTRRGGLRPARPALWGALRA